MAETKTLPSHDVFTVTGDQGSKRWTRIGAAFANKDGKGFNVALDALPVNGALVLREHEARSAAPVSAGSPDPAP
jgi:hypothetical protein